MERRLVVATRRGIVCGDRVRWQGDVRCLCTSGGALYAGTRGGGVLRSDDGGGTWLQDGLDGETVMALAPAAAGAVLAGTQPPAIHLRDATGVWRELPAFRALCRAYWRQPAMRPHTAYVSALATAGDTILAGIEALGIRRSADGGATWDHPRRGVAFDCHALALAGERAYEGAGFGASRSRDAGRTWTRMRRGLDRRYVMALAVDPADPECWYVAAAPLARAHSRDSRAVIFRSSGDAWVKVTDELTHLPNALLCPEPDHVVAGLRDGTLMDSSDRGAKWRTREGRLDGIRALASVGSEAG